MNAPLLTYRMTVEQFLVWVDARDAARLHDEPKWELFDGVPTMQEHEKWRHGKTKYLITRTLEAAIGRAALPLEVAVDSLGVRIAQNESYQPEVVVFPKALINDDDRYAPCPVIVVEVLSPSSRHRDLKIKAEGYARVPSIEHYLVVDPETRQVLPHRRDGSTLRPAETAIGSGVLRLDPPGLAVDINAVFA